MSQSNIDRSPTYACQTCEKTQCGCKDVESPLPCHFYAEPVKQEPVAVVDEIGKRLDGTYIFNAVGKVDVGQQLYAAPVDAKAIRAEALEEAAKVCRTAQAKGLQSIREAIEAAIRGLK